MSDKEAHLTHARHAEAMEARAHAADAWKTDQPRTDRLAPGTHVKGPLGFEGAVVRELPPHGEVMATSLHTREGRDQHAHEPRYEVKQAVTGKLETFERSQLTAPGEGVDIGVYASTLPAPSQTVVGGHSTGALEARNTERKPPHRRE